MFQLLDHAPAALGCLDSLQGNFAAQNRKKMHDVRRLITSIPSWILKYKRKERNINAIGGIEKVL